MKEPGNGTPPLSPAEQEVPEEEVAATQQPATAAAATSSEEDRDTGGRLLMTTPTPPLVRRQVSNGEAEGLQTPGRDDTSSRQFMSEPSVSDEDHSSRIIAPHRLPRFTSNSNEYYEGRHMTLPNNLTNSPGGNTSLSSWDSPARGQHKVQLHFAAERPGPVLPPTVTVENHGQGPRVRVQRRLAPRTTAPPLPPDNDHPDPHNSNHEEQPDNELLDMPNISDSPSARLDLPDLPAPRIGQPSINMAFSDSEEEEEGIATTTTGASADEPLDWESSASKKQPQSFPLADDERTNPQRRRHPLPRQHHRNRSGDMMAALLATGGNDWKGMAKDNIPVPEAGDETDDSASPQRGKKPQLKKTAEARPEPLESDPANTSYPPPGSYSSIPPPPPFVQQFGGPGMMGMPPPGSPMMGPMMGPMPTQSGVPMMGMPPQQMMPMMGMPPQHMMPMMGMPQGSPMMGMPQGSPMMGGQPASMGAMGPPMPGMMGGPLSYGPAWYPPSPYGEPAMQYPVVETAPDYSGRLPGMESRFPFPDEEDESDYSDSDRPMTVQQNQMFSSQISVSSRNTLEEMEHQHEDRNFLGAYQNVRRPKTVYDFESDSPFANLGKKSTDKAARSAFMPNLMTAAELEKYPTYTCPRCKTKQREFFTVSDAPRALSEPSNYLALYFGIYVIASLFIFGLEEGWKPLDCVYFAVITLTTAGLGDYVPTTDANKIVCSIFIYFGVACIGLLLGSYIANMLDDRAFREAKKKQIDSCPNCERMQIAKDAVAATHSPDRKSVSSAASHSRSALHMSMRGFDASADTSKTAAYVPRNHHRHDKQRTPQTSEHLRKPGLDMPSISETHQSPADPNASPVPPPPPSINTYAPAMSPMANPNFLGSPMTRQILGRQRHTRHQSIDATNFSLSQTDRKYSVDLPSTHTPPTISESAPLHPPNSAPQVPFHDARQAAHSLRGSVFLDEDGYASDDDYSDDSSVTSASTMAEIVDENATKIKAAKYVFLTLKQALVNSLVIIAVGCVGFIVTEEFNVVDSWYFTTVLLTTVGYGDIVPITNGGKLFATVYILVAGTVLINNMSMISMIPLELRRRRIERVVLTQFGDQLDDAALRELATGPLIQRLSLSAKRADGLDECTREMFSLAMLVRLGKVTEDDIRETFAVFRRLDVNDEGVLNSKSIIAGMIQKRRSNLMSRQAAQQAAGMPMSNASTTAGHGNGMPFMYMPQVPLTATTPAPYGTLYQMGGMGVTPGQSQTPGETTSLLQPRI